MNKLLRAGFARLWRSKVFYLALAVVVAVAAYACLSVYQTSLKWEQRGYADEVLFAVYVFIGILSAAFVSLFVGTEYSDGTIRNKLVTGSNRTQVYLANLVVCSVAGLLMAALYSLVVLGLGAVLLGPGLRMPLASLLLRLGVGALLVVFFTALFVFISMLISNKTIAAIIALVLVFMGIFFAAHFNSGLDEPEFYSGIVITGEGTVEKGDDMPNPNYLSGAERERVEWMMDIMPTGQAFQLAASSLERPARVVGCQLALTAGLMLIGIALFRRKDIK